MCLLCLSSPSLQQLSVKVWTSTYTGGLYIRTKLYSVYFLKNKKSPCQLSYRSFWKSGLKGARNATPKTVLKSHLLRYFPSPLAYWACQKNAVCVCAKQKNKNLHFWVAGFQKTEPPLNPANEKNIWGSVGLHLQCMPSSADFLAALLQHAYIYVMTPPSVMLCSAPHCRCFFGTLGQTLIGAAPPPQQALFCFHAFFFYFFMHFKFHSCESRRELQVSKELFKI